MRSPLKNDRCFSSLLLHSCSASKAMSFLMVTPYNQQPPASRQLPTFPAATTVGSETVSPPSLTSPLASAPSGAGSETTEASFLASPLSSETTSEAEDDCFLAMLCFEDEVQPGVERAVKALRTGSWWRGGGGGGGAKEVVMLTGVSRMHPAVPKLLFHCLAVTDTNIPWIRSRDCCSHLVLSPQWALFLTFGTPALAPCPLGSSQVTTSRWPSR